METKPSIAHVVSAGERRRDEATAARRLQPLEDPASESILLALARIRNIHKLRILKLDLIREEYIHCINLQLWLQVFPYCMEITYTRLTITCTTKLTHMQHTMFLGFLEREYKALQS